MKYIIPEVIPNRKGFISELMKVIFFDNDAEIGYRYAENCQKKVDELGLDHTISPDHDILNLLFLMNHHYYLLKGENHRLVHPNFLTTYPDQIHKTFCEAGSINQWLREDTGYLNSTFHVALFYSYLFLIIDGRNQEQWNYFEKLLSYLGVVQIDDLMVPYLSTFDLKKREGSDYNIGLEVEALTDLSVQLFTLAMLTMCCIVGRKPKVQEQYISIFQNKCKSMLQKYQDACDGIEFANNTLFESVNRFDPRTIRSSEPDKMKIENFYVPVQFYRNEREIEHPLSGIDQNVNSKRAILQAKTGMGKSTYLQTMVLGMLKDRFLEKPDTQLTSLFNDMEVPEGMMVISVPASMFSYCFQKREYNKWTKSFVDLYFNAMWKLSGGYNFFSNRSIQDLKEARQFLPSNEEETLEIVDDYLKRMADEGKLVLILDSFDEIYSGDMRNAYIRALNSFYDDYCEGKVGAHVIISSREMSPATMNSLKAALKINDNDIYKINSFDEARQKKLVKNWIYFLTHDRSEKEKQFNLLWKQIQENHFYQKYADNPYTLSVLCYDSGKGLVNITKSFVDSLIDEMNYNQRNCSDFLVLNMIHNMRQILQEIALEIVESGQTYFSNLTLNQKLRSHVSASGMEEETIRHAIAQVNEIIVTDVGLVVPADGRDDDYQFINDLIRYELAVEAVIQLLGTSDEGKFFIKGVLPEIADVQAFVGVMVPLICHMEDNFQISEKLVYDLTMRNFDNKEENQILTEAVEDLVLTKYATSLFNISNPPAKYKNLVYRLQRLALMRLFTSTEFHPAADQLRAIENSTAYKNNKDKIKSY